MNLLPAPARSAIPWRTLDQGLTAITGAGGFLGSALVQQAGKSGHRIRAIRRSASPGPPDRENPRADLLDLDALQRAFEGATTVIHAAGLAHVFRTDRRPAKDFHTVNVLGTRNVMTAAIRCSVRHMVLISSVSVYGGASREPRDETSACAPEGPYATSKLESEHAAIEAAESAGIRLTILRMATLYGSGDPGNVARLIRLIDRSRFVWVGSGANRKSLIHKEDAARACFAAVVAPGPDFEVFNVSSVPVTMREIVETIGRALGRKLPGWQIPSQGVFAILKAAENLTRRSALLGRVRSTLLKWTADDSYRADKLQERLGFKARIELSEGIAEEARWYRNEDRG